MSRTLTKGLTIVSVILGQALAAVTADSTVKADELNESQLLAGAEKNAAAIRNGQALNALTKLIRDTGVSVAPDSLQSLSLPHLRLRQGNDGVPFRSDTGQLLEFCLPEELQGTKYRSAAAELQKAKAEVLAELTKGSVSVKSAQRLQRAVDAVTAVFSASSARSVRLMPYERFQQYKRVTQFLSALRREIDSVIVSRQSALPANLRFQGETLRDLLDHLTSKGLEIAPASCQRDGVSTYVQLYEMLLAHFQSSAARSLVVKNEKARATRSRVLSHEERHVLRHKRAVHKARVRSERIAQRRTIERLRAAYIVNAAASVQWRPFAYAQHMNASSQRMNQAFNSLPRSSGSTSIRYRVYTIHY